VHATVGNEPSSWWSWWCAVGKAPVSSDASLSDIESGQIKERSFMLLLLSCAGAGILLMVFILHSRGLKRLSCEDHVQPMASLYGTVDTVSPSHALNQQEERPVNALSLSMPENLLSAVGARLYASLINVGKQQVLFVGWKMEVKRLWKFHIAKMCGSDRPAFSNYN
jgi:hypothetical protein